MVLHPCHVNLNIKKTKTGRRTNPMTLARNRNSSHNHRRNSSFRVDLFLPKKNVSAIAGGARGGKKETSTKNRNRTER